MFGSLLFKSFKYVGHIDITKLDHEKTGHELENGEQYTELKNICTYVLIYTAQNEISLRVVCQFLVSRLVLPKNKICHFFCQLSVPQIPSDTLTLNSYFGM